MLKFYSKNNGFQTIERPNLFPQGWAVLYFVPNCLSDYLKFVRPKKGGKGLVSDRNKAKQSIKIRVRD
ncbi:MAG: hypothetical protein AVO34_06195 [Firmicutes bacterium ML8_F2]|nr:MAG: hypothetical protein AVO34_06195 [Firmicutes bacterium ML8_F2]